MASDSGLPPCRRCASVFDDQLTCANRRHWTSMSLAIVYSTRLFRRKSKKTSKLRVTGLVRGIHRSVIGEFPAEMASNAEIVSIWWRHHVTCQLLVSEVFSGIRLREISQEVLANIISVTCVWRLQFSKLLSHRIKHKFRILHENFHSVQTENCP